MTPSPTSIWSMIAGANLTLALPHLVMGFKQRGAWVHRFFAMGALGAAWLVTLELAIMHAVTTEEAGRALQWAHLPVLAMAIAIVGFVDLYFGTGRRWLGVVGCLLRDSGGGDQFRLPAESEF
jgi:hypothetical protein